VDFSNGAIFQVEDINRDGLPDLVARKTFSYPDGHLETTDAIIMNQGIADPTGTPSLSLVAAPTRSASTGGTAVNPLQPPSFADLDGDGYFDAISYYRTDGSSVDVRRAISFGDGMGLVNGSQSSYMSVLSTYSPNDPSTARAGDFGWALVDANGD